MIKTDFMTLLEELDSLYENDITLESEDGITITNDEPAPNKSIEELRADLQDYVADLTEAKSLDKDLVYRGLNWILKNLMRVVPEAQREDFFIEHFTEDFTKWLSPKILDQLKQPPLYLNKEKLAWIKYLDLYKMSVKDWIKRWDVDFGQDGNLSINLKDYV
jgi:hypothetical protein